MKQHTTGVSVCIVTYNSANDISRCLDTLYEQTNRNNIRLDVYVSDNVSTDDTVKLVKTRYPEVTIIRNSRNGGYGYGHNKVIKRSKSKYHLILNPDITFTEDVLSQLVGYMDKHQNTVVITPSLRYQNGELQYVPRRFPKIKYVLSSRLAFMLDKYRKEYTLEDDYPVVPCEIDVCTGAFMLARTNILRKVGGFDQRFFMYFEDLDLSIRLKEFGDIVLDPTTHVVHSWNRASMKSNRMFLLQIQSMLKFYKKLYFEKRPPQ